MTWKPLPDTWFDEGTEVELVDDYRPDLASGLFRGLRHGQRDEEICRFDEFREEIA